LALVQGITCEARSSSNTRGGLLVAIKMQIRRGTATAWATADPTLVAGELGFVTDTGKTAFKIGDGTTSWITLPYVNATYPELLPDAGGDLNLSIVQGRYPLLNTSTYTNIPSEFSGGATDGDSVLMVTVPASGIVIQELTTSKTSKRWIRGKNAGTWSAWQRLHGVIATDSLTVVNLTATGTVVANLLGVGTASPQAKVHVAVSNPTRGIVGIVSNTGAASLTGSQIQLTQNTIQDYVIGQPATVDALAVWRGRNTAADGTELVRLTSTALASTVNVTAPGIQAGASGLTSSGGLTVSSGNASLVSLTCSSTASGITPTTANHFATKSYVDLNGLYQYVDVIDSATASSPTNIPIASSPSAVNSPFNSRSAVTEGETYWYKAQFTGNNSGFGARYGILTINYLTPSSFNYEVVFGARSTGVFLTSVTPTNLQYTLYQTIIETAQSTSVNRLTTGYQVNVGHGNGDALTKFFWYGVRVLGPANRPGMTV
jgi:hypothetical protein